MFRILICLSFFILANTTFAHVGEHPSVHDIVHGIKHRLKQNFFIVNKPINNADLVSTLTKKERKVLGTEHISFNVSGAVVISVACDIRLTTPFWLADQNFQKTNLEFQLNKKRFCVWQKEFKAGWIGLGVNSLEGGKQHYFLTMKPKEENASIKVTNIYPGFHSVGVVKIGEKPYIDSPDTLSQVPSELKGQDLIRTSQDRCDVAKLIGIFVDTDYPATDRPDQIVLTWSEDPRHTQAVQWRTSTRIESGMVRYRTKDETTYKLAKAKTMRLETPDVANDPVVHKHTAVLRGLKADTTYVYSVGSDTAGWTETFEFTTAPDGEKPFSFIYMGDAQNGLDTWGTLLQKAYKAKPDAAFYMMAGDLVNRGAQRHDWDSFFHNSKGVYNHRTLVPAIGNHEMHGGFPDLYLKQFALPKNGAKWLTQGRSYSFEYSNACFIILDTNHLIDLQTEWLEKQLANTKATWKFVMYHHPAYSPRPSINNTYIADVWGPIFDKYRVDVALQGHDHSYVRSYPIKGKKKAPKGEGTIYVVSVSGTKYYKQNPIKFAQVAFTNVSTYQALDISIRGKQLHYRSYDGNGAIKDEFVIEK